MVGKEEEKGNLNTLGGGQVRVTATVALEQPGYFQFAEVVTELIQGVSLRGELEGSEYSFVDLFGGPAADRIAAMQENLQQSDHPSVVDLDARVTDGAYVDGEGEALEQAKAGPGQGKRGRGSR